MRVLLFGPPTTAAYRAFDRAEMVCGGGWTENLLSALSKVDGIELVFAFYLDSAVSVADKTYQGISYIALPVRVKGLSACNEQMIQDLHKMLELATPDVTHIIGTEREHDYELFKLAGAEKTVISITGLTSIYAEHYLGGMERNEYTHRSLGDILRRTSILRQQRLFAKWGESEKRLIGQAKYVMGRTTWDQAFVKRMSPDCKYIYCGEILNSCYNGGKWSPETMKRHTIFVSQGSYPLKGLHQLIKALPMIAERFSDVRVVVGGPDLLAEDTWIKKIKATSYAQYIRDLLRQNGISKDRFLFTGPLNAEQMKEQYLSCNVFVLPSLIENSPNSLGEAMMLGVPVVASYVGGIPDMAKHGETAFLYPFDEPYMLAHYVCELFADDDLAERLGNAAVAAAKKRFDEKHVADTTVSAYRMIDSNQRRENDQK